MNAQAFYDLMFNQLKPREAIEQYAGEGEMGSGECASSAQPVDLLVRGGLKEHDAPRAGEAR